MRFYNLLLASKKPVMASKKTVTTIAHQGKIHFCTTAGMRLNHHGKFKVQRFQLFEQIIKDDCTPRSTVLHLPLRWLINKVSCT